MKKRLGLILVLSREGGKLMGEIPGEDKFELIPASATTFFIKAFGGSLTFERDREGNVAGFLLQAERQDIPAKKIVPPLLSAEALIEFSGDFYSAELQTTYSLAVQDGQLVAQHPRNPDTHLEPSAIDQFTGDNWWFGKARFVRDQEETISGFVLSGSRVRNLRFVKK